MEYVCINCFSDDELIGFITTTGNIGDCDCCKSKNT